MKEVREKGQGQPLNEPSKEIGSGFSIFLLLHSLDYVRFCFLYLAVLLFIQSCYPPLSNAVSSSSYTVLCFLLTYGQFQLVVRALRCGVLIFAWLRNNDNSLLLILTELCPLPLCSSHALT